MEGKHTVIDPRTMLSVATVEWSLTQGTHGSEFSASAYSKRLGAGQILDTLAERYPEDAKLAEIMEVWCKYHRNDLKAGLPEQEAAVKAFIDKDDLRYDYDRVCAYLKQVGLYEIPLPEGAKCTGSFSDEILRGERGYRYGEAWVYSEIPEAIVTQIQGWATHTKNYLVILKLYLGEYEKVARSLVYADTPEEAAKLGLEGECHNDPSVTGEGLDLETWDDGWVYKVGAVHELTDAETEVFEKYRI